MRTRREPGRATTAAIGATLAWLAGCASAVAPDATSARTDATIDVGGDLRLDAARDVRADAARDVRADAAHDARLDAFDASDEMRVGVPSERVIGTCMGELTLHGVTCDQASSHIDCNGQGVCIDGVAYAYIFAPRDTPNLCAIREVGDPRVCCSTFVACAMGCAPDWEARARALPHGGRPMPEVLCAETPWDAGGDDGARD